MLIPPKDIQYSFQDAISSVPKIDQVRRESQTLLSIRDTLLPKLLSGQLRIPDAEKLIGETAQPPR
ncbi:MAG: hypothetical protein D3903_13330 [Candidatus Electrothrix sp. GM3_4]|nr:hypothetical protein [Candidatus Electrothrix sp. GM3_4]